MVLMYRIILKMSDDLAKGLIKMLDIKEFIEDLKQNKNVITRGDLQGIVEARCKKTGEDEENILKKIDEKNENKSGGKV